LGQLIIIITIICFLLCFSTLSLYYMHILFFFMQQLPTLELAAKSELGLSFVQLCKPKFVMIFFSLSCHMLQMCHLYGHISLTFFCLLVLGLQKIFFKKSSDRNSFAWIPLFYELQGQGRGWVMRFSQPRNMQKKS